MEVKIQEEGGKRGIFEPYMSFDLKQMLCIKRKLRTLPMWEQSRGFTRPLQLFVQFR